MKKSNYKFMFLLISIYLIIAFIIFYLLNVMGWDLTNYFFRGSIIFILFGLVLNENVDIPILPKLIYLFFSILVVICAFLLNISNIFSFVLLLTLFFFLDYYYKNENNPDRFKNLKKNVLLILMIIGGVFLSYLLLFVCAFLIQTIL